MNQTYINAVRLLLAVAPVVFRKPLFALKGGTASKSRTALMYVWFIGGSG